MVRKPKVLFLDDDLQVLKAFKRVMRKELDLRTADNGHAALAILRKHPEIDVVVTDQRMPEMDGATFLVHAYRLAPNTMRIMLTGTNSLNVATAALNQGHVYKFINKPSNPKEILKAILQAYEERRRFLKDKDLLEQTLEGAVRVMMEVLALSNPGAYRRARRVQRWADDIALRLGLEVTSHLHMASILWAVGEMTLPNEVQDKLNRAEKLTKAEADLVQRSALSAHELISHIPHMADVANIVLYSRKNFDGSGWPEEGVSGQDIPLEARILRILLDIIGRMEKPHRQESFIAWLPQEQTPHAFDPALISRIRQAYDPRTQSREIREWVELEVGLSRLLDGDQLGHDCKTVDGRLLLAAGNEITRPVLEKMRQVHKLVGIQEPITILREQIMTQSA